MKSKVNIKQSAFRFVGFLSLTTLLVSILTLGRINAVPSVTITSPTASQIISAGPVTVTGTASPNTTVVVSENDIPLGTDVSDGGGNWSILVESLANGSHTLRAEAIQNPDYGYFFAVNQIGPTIPDDLVSTNNRITLSDNTLNAGPTWPITESAPHYSFFAGSPPPSGDKLFFHQGFFSITSPPRQLEVSGSSELDPTNSYTAGSTTNNGGRWTADGSTYYSANSSGNSISVVDVATNTQTGSLTVLGPQALDIAANGYLYVANNGVIGNTNRVTVINPATNTQVKTIDVDCDTNSSIGNIIFDRGKQHYFVSCALDGEIRKFDAATDEELETFDISSALMIIGSTFTSIDNSKIYAMGVFGQTGDDKLIVIDSADGSILQNITLTDGAITAYLSPDGQFIYVSTPGELSASFKPNIDIISTATDTIVHHIDTTSVGIPGAVTYTAGQVATSNVSFQLGASTSSPSSSVDLAKTGQSKSIVTLIAVLCLLISSTILIGQRYKHKFYK